jgi:cytochrome P450
VDTTAEKVAGSGGCPVLAGYDPMDPAQLRDPYSGWRRAQEEAPVFYDEKYGFWTVTRYEDILALINDTERFSNRMAIPMPLPPEDLRERMPVYPFATALLFMDDPEHRRVRTMLQEPFVPRRLKAREPRIAERARELLAERDHRRIEFLAEYGVPLALTVIGDLVGVPEPDWPMLEQSIYGAFRIASGAAEESEMRALAEGQARYWEYLVALAEERHRNPTDDFSSVLAAQTDDEGNHFSPEEIAAHINTMLGAGFETSAQLMTLGVYGILAHQDQWELLKSDPSLLQGAVEECARYRTVIKRNFRLTNTEVEIGGVTIPEGSLVAYSPSAANHDAAVFPDPQRFDITRPSIPTNLTFGRGMHYCLGAPLAKIEMRITLEQLVELAPGARLVEGQELEWKPDYRLEGICSLQVDLGPLS